MAIKKFKSKQDVYDVVDIQRYFETKYGKTVERALTHFLNPDHEYSNGTLVSMELDEESIKEFESSETGISTEQCHNAASLLRKHVGKDTFEIYYWW